MKKSKREAKSEAARKPPASRLDEIAWKVGAYCAESAISRLWEIPEFRELWARLNPNAQQDMRLAAILGCSQGIKAGIRSLAIRLTDRKSSAPERLSGSRNHVQQS